MPSKRHIVILVALAHLLGACSAGSDPTAPATTAPASVPIAAMATPSADPTVQAPEPTLALPSPNPTPDCPRLDADYRPPDVDLTFTIGHMMAVRARIDSIQPSEPGFVVPPPVDLRSDRQLPGGRDLPVELWIGDWAQSPEWDLASMDLISLESSYRVNGGAWHDLEVVSPLRGTPYFGTTYFAGTLGALPDLDAVIDFRLEVAWRDQCFTYQASRTTDVEVLSRATVGDCALFGDAAFAQLNALFDAPLRLGDGRGRLGVSWANGTYAAVGGSGDGPYSLAMYDASLAPASATPGAMLRLAWSQEALQLENAGPDLAPWFKRGAVIRYLERGGLYGGGDEPTVVERSPLTERAQGGFEIRAPVEPGRYVIALDLSFTSACYFGGAVAAIGVDVVDS